MKIDEKIIYKVLRNFKIANDELVALIKEMSIEQIKDTAKKMNNSFNNKSVIIEELVSIILKDITMEIVESLLQCNNENAILDLKNSYLNCVKDCKN